MRVQQPHYWLELKCVSNNQVSFDLLLIQQGKNVQKFTKNIDILKQKSFKLGYLQQANELIKIMNNHKNYEIDSQSKEIRIIWKLSAKGFNKQKVSLIKLVPQNMTLFERLQIQNQILKKKLNKIETKLSPLKNKSCQKQNENQIQKTQSGIKEQKKNRKVNNGYVAQKHKNDEKTLRSIKNKQKQQQVRVRMKETKQNKEYENGEQYQQNEMIEYSIIHPEAQQIKRTFIGDKVRIQYLNGDTYFGQMKNGKYDGFGIYTSRKTGTYEGNWKEGDADGKGISIDMDGNQHQGMYKDGEKNGWGVENYVTGQKYQGEFKNDSREGQGKYWFTNGQTYEGQWKNNLFDGNGIETFSDGSFFKGKWKEDQKDGMGIMVMKNGKQIRQWWSKGSLMQEQVII